ncbi:hypothetical protein C8Q74DRAFT_467560 [Fomes fomentarius]|nr:hypothetical protein C8Q74DRAFT_467560 [Fomes fomentarius]
MCAVLVVRLCGARADLLEVVVMSLSLSEPCIASVRVTNPGAVPPRHRLPFVTYISPPLSCPGQNMPGMCTGERTIVACSDSRVYCIRRMLTGYCTPNGIIVAAPYAPCAVALAQRASVRPSCTAFRLSIQRTGTLPGGSRLLTASPRRPSRSLR